MKTLFLVILLFAIGSNSGSPAQTYLDQQKFMPISEAKKRYGTKPFSENGFKSGSTQERAAMSVSLIKSKAFIGTQSDEIRNKLGSHNGHFWNDHIPTYIIEEGWGKEADTWQLVFLIDAKGLVTDIRIHKNCCQKK